MDVSKKEVYDLVVSLGGNCMAANNLIRRKLRRAAMPFDWVQMSDGRVVRWLAEHVADGFAEFCLRRNLELIPEGDPRWNRFHPERVQYFDRESGYLFYNHFNRPLDVSGEYERVYSVLRRRLDRFMASLDRADSALLVLATFVQLRDEDLLVLEEAFRGRFPKVAFRFVVMRFSAECNCVRKLGRGIEVREIVRGVNPYDFFMTNYEWAYLDDVDTREPRFRRPSALSRMMRRIFRLFAGKRLMV